MVLKGLLDMFFPPAENLSSNYKEDPYIPTPDKEKITKVPIPPVWSTYQYMLKPDFKGLEDLRLDKRVYFTMPSGCDFDEYGNMRLWFITFPYGGREDERREFFVYQDSPLVANVGNSGGSEDG